MKDILYLLRVHQWVKNVFVLSPLIFSGDLRDGHKLYSAILTIAVFCCVASSMYIFNDLFDFKRDRLHPKKKDRPLSLGSITPSMAWGLALPLLGLGMIGAFLVNMRVGEILLIYFLLHLIYNLGIRNFAIADVFFIAFGFELRIWAGAFAIGVMPSMWLQLCAFLLALFLGLIKRRSELIDIKDRADEHRLALQTYRGLPLDAIIIAVSILTVISYVLYAISNLKMIYSSIFVVFGIFRYMHLVYVHKVGDEPGEVLFKDWPSFLNIFLWLACIIAIIY